MGPTCHRICGLLAYINNSNQQDWSVWNKSLLKRLKETRNASKTNLQTQHITQSRDILSHRTKYISSLYQHFDIITKIFCMNFQYACCSWRSTGTPSLLVVLWNGHARSLCGGTYHTPGLNTQPNTTANILWMGKGQFSSSVHLPFSVHSRIFLSV